MNTKIQTKIFLKMSLLLFFKTSQNKTKFRNKQLSTFSSFPHIFEKY